MKPTEIDITLVERYFDAELNAEEITQFNKRVAQDKAFEALVQREKIIIGAIRIQGLLDNLQYLKSIEEKIQGEQAQPPASKIKSCTSMRPRRYNHPPRSKDPAAISAETDECLRHISPLPEHI